MTADQAIVVSQYVEVQVTPVSDPIIDAGSDIESLDLALKVFPSAPAFRVTWNFSGLGASVNATEVYRRAQQTLALYRVDSDEMGLRTTREFYTKVQDSAIDQVAAQFEGTFRNLTAYGAIHDTQKSDNLRPRAAK